MNRVDPTLQVNNCRNISRRFVVLKKFFRIMPEYKIFFIFSVQIFMGILNRYGSLLPLKMGYSMSAFRKKPQVILDLFSSQKADKRWSLFLLFFPISEYFPLCVCIILLCLPTKLMTLLYCSKVPHKITMKAPTGHLFFTRCLFVDGRKIIMFYIFVKHCITKRGSGY